MLSSSLLKPNLFPSFLINLHQLKILIWFFCFLNLLCNIYFVQLYDLAHPGLARNSVSGCPQTDEVCNAQESTFRCWEHGVCVGSLSEARCQCLPGFTGPSCNTATIPTTFKPQVRVLVKYVGGVEVQKVNFIHNLGCLTSLCYTLQGFRLPEYLM